MKKISFFSLLLVSGLILVLLTSCNTASNDKTASIKTTEPVITEVETTQELKASAKIKTVKGLDDKNSQFFELISNGLKGNFNNLFVMVSTENYNQKKDKLESVWYFEGEEIFTSDAALNESDNLYSMGIVIQEGCIPTGSYKCLVKLNGATADSKEFTVAQIDYEPINMSGSGSKSTDFFEVYGGLTVFDFKNNGSGNFIAMLMDEDGEKIELLVNEIGSVSGKKAMYLDAGKYFINIDQGSNWNFNILQPRLLETAELPYTFEASSPDISKVVLADDLIQINYSHQGTGNFVVNLLNTNGQKEELLVNEIGSISGSTTIRGDGRKHIISIELADGKYIIDINYKSEISSETTSNSTTEVEETIKTEETTASTSGADSSEVLEQIMAKAKQDWPNDTEMQNYQYKKQVEAYNKICNLPNSSNYNAEILTQAQSDWTDDYEMQLYQYNKQLQAYFDVLGLPNTNNYREEILNKAKKDWPGDYEMQLYQYKKEVG